MKLAISGILLLLFVAATPVSAQLNQRIDSLFSSYNLQNTTGISVLVIKGGKVSYKKAFGLANIEQQTPATTATNYRIASVTKQFTAMAVLILVQQKKLSLEDPITKFFPGFPPYGKEVTIRRMLHHTAGLPDYSDLMPQSRTTPLSDMDVLDLVTRQDTANFTPGSKFSYSNTAYVLLGLIIAKVSGKPFAQFLKDEIFGPLKMRHTTTNAPDANIPDRAYGYNLRDGQLKQMDQSRYSYLLGDGGIYSSVDDFYKWDQSFYTNRLLQPALLQEMFTPGAWPSPTLGYGYGWEIEEKYGMKRYVHTGGTTGFSSYYVRYPEARLSIVILGNQNDGLELGRYVAAIEQMYLKQQ
ncbi:CubicO group peptidase, beta-lactamase class C family [Chitinophaga jiangningensis]|uniref:CubicO group peptidase, beta-lactamase class C family n=1 Tax=Chitinophaga jiangningensis TaxID=1419482 RepID=A0A1M6Y423_9BACT|nr:serine hydrolase domain-containing protein [Chitinophaga jiangningensis]SHL12898.1 CubicO group peptidase, beta-lactamase class C family [Chitinophaga jiangningensis]